MAVLDWLQQLLGGGDPEAQGAAAASTAMMPATNALGRGVYGAGQAVGGDIGDMLNALWGTAKIPGQVYAGERQPSVDDALNVALTTIGGGFRPAGSLGMGGIPKSIRVSPTDEFTSAIRVRGKLFTGETHGDAFDKMVKRYPSWAFDDIPETDLRLFKTNDGRVLTFQEALRAREESETLRKSGLLGGP